MAAAGIVTVGAYYKVRARSAWANYAGVASGIAGVILIITAVTLSTPLTRNASGANPMPSQRRPRCPHLAHQASHDSQSCGAISRPSNMTCMFLLIQARIEARGPKHVASDMFSDAALRADDIRIIPRRSWQHRPPPHAAMMNTVSVRGQRLNGRRWM
jgi:hypothetical protein